MADVIYHSADGVVEMTPANNGPTNFDKLPIRSVIVSGPTAGVFQVKLNNTTFQLRTTVEHLTLQFEIRMGVNTFEGVSIPANGHVYAMLDQMP